MCARSIESVEYVVSCASVRDESDLINDHSRTHDRNTLPLTAAQRRRMFGHSTLWMPLTIHSNTCSQPLPVAECPCVPTRRTRPYNPTSQSRMPSVSPPLPSPFLPYHMPFHYSDPLGAPFRERRGVVRIRLRVLEHPLVLPVVIKVAHVERVVDPRYVRRRDLARSRRDHEMEEVAALLARSRVLVEPRTGAHLCKHTKTSELRGLGIMMLCVHTLRAPCPPAALKPFDRDPI